MRRVVASFSSRVPERAPALAATRSMAPRGRDTTIRDPKCGPSGDRIARARIDRGFGQIHEWNARTENSTAVSDEYPTMSSRTGIRAKRPFVRRRLDPGSSPCTSRLLRLLVCRPVSLSPTTMKTPTASPCGARTGRSSRSPDLVQEIERCGSSQCRSPM